MSHRRGRVWASALLLALTGCTPSSFLTPFAPPAPEQHLTDGSVDEVSARLQAALAEEGVALLEKRVGRELRLAGKATSGKLFCLLLNPDRVKGDKRTVVAINWERGEDNELRRTILRALAPQVPEDDAPLSEKRDSSGR